MNVLTERSNLIVTPVSPVNDLNKAMFSKSLRKKVISFRLIDILISRTSVFVIANSATIAFPYTIPHRRSCNRAQLSTSLELPSYTETLTCSVLCTVLVHYIKKSIVLSNEKRKQEI